MGKSLDCIDMQSIASTKASECSLTNTSKSRLFSTPHALQLEDPTENEKIGVQSLALAYAQIEGASEGPGKKKGGFRRGKFVVRLSLGWDRRRRHRFARRSLFEFGCVLIVTFFTSPPRFLAPARQDTV